MARSASSDLAPGTLVGPYRIESLLGAGGVGTVYAAVEPTIRKRVAIKVLRRTIDEDAAAAARFEREARAANQVHHPSIVEVFAIGQLPDGRPYLVMSLLDGRSLRAELEARGTIPLAEAWLLARAIADALAAAHAAGIVHRDLKPDNVFLERFAGEREGASARVRLLDFGIAKLLETKDGDEGDAPMKLTGTGVPIGTPAYMAPEQWWGEGIGPATDQYALGVLLFELCAGRPPFDSRHFAELIQKHVHAPPPTLAEVGVEVPPEVEAFVQRLLAKATTDRFADLHEAIDAGNQAFYALLSADLDASRAGSLPPGAAGYRPPIALPASLDPSADPATFPTEIAPPLPRDPAPSAPSSAAPRADAIVHGPAARLLPPVLARSFRRYLLVHALVLVFGFAATVAAGYAGRFRHNPREWFEEGGFAQFPVVFSFLVGVVALIVLARRRAATGAASLAGFWIALVPALVGAFGTYTGWRVILAHLGEMPATDRFAIFNEGTYEANACRFLGFSLATLLLLSLSALPAVSGVTSATTTLAGALGVRRTEASAASFGLAALALAAAAIGAPSGALIAGAGAVVLFISAALPTVHTETAARDELERALAGLLAVGLAAAVAITRIEAREAALWADSPTRAERVAEILAAHGEHDATLPIAAASLLAILLVEALRVRRLARFGAIQRPRPAALALLAVLAIAIVGDVVQHGRFIGKRDELRADIAAQFALFARLDPPPGDALDPERFAPHRATALQITRDVVAVDGKGVARLLALASPDGAAQIGTDLNHALAQAAVAQREPGAIDLSAFVDREVRGADLVHLLRIARAAGVRRIELLLTRGAAPRMLAGGPPEMDVVIPRDFVAVLIEVSDQGLTIAEDRAFGEIAPALIQAALARAAEAPVVVGIGAR